MTGFYKFISEDDFFNPTLWIKYTEGAPLHVDANIRFSLSSLFWFGVGGSSSGSFNGELGIFIGDVNYSDSLLKVGYGYSYSFTTFGPFFGPTHEINLAFLLIND